MYENKACELLDLNKYELIWSSINFNGVNMSCSAVKDVIQDNIVTTTRTRMQKVMNQNRIINTVVNKAFSSLDYNTLQDINLECCNGLFSRGGLMRTKDIKTEAGHTIKPITSKDLYDKISEVHQMDCKVYAAIELFSYICKTQPFDNENYTTALLSANKILIEDSIGVMVLPVRELPILHELILDYVVHNNQKTKDNIKDYLLDNCIKFIYV